MTSLPMPVAGEAATSDSWRDAFLAARLLAAECMLGGAVVRSPAGPARDAWLAAYGALAGPVRRIPACITDDRLLGGIDLAATLANGRPVVARGVLADAAGGTLVVPMAERIDGALAGRLTAALDDGGIRLILLDEGEGDERVPSALAERCGFWLELPVRPPADAPGGAVPLAATDAATVELDDPVATLCATAAAFGIDSPRAALFAVRAARVHAVDAGRDAVTQADVVAAARLVLVPRATRLPAPDADAPPDAAPPLVGDDPAGRTDSERSVNQLGEIIVAAASATLPSDVLAALAAGRAVASRGSGAGAKRKAAVRGRPAPSRAGDPRSGARLALVDTLRAAAPWQAPRRGDGDARVRVRRADFRIRRFVDRAEATTIFAVDASGSAAVARLAEAKGAVELLLAQAYVKRTQVALVAFRGTAAEVVLPPTRSLARAKRCLADLAGGGGTPLAAGLAVAYAVARGERGRGRTPFVVVLTDGRANIDAAGLASRDRAAADALAAARRFATDRIASAFIDVAPRPRAEGAALASAMAARYAPLPAASAATMAAAIRAFAPAA